MFAIVLLYRLENDVYSVLMDGWMSVSVVSRVAQDVGLGENIFKGFNDVTKIKNKPKKTPQVCHDSGSLVEIWKAWYW